jgi:hypothetical protein
LALCKIKGFFENRDQNIIARGYKAPEEKDGYQWDKLRPIGLYGICTHVLLMIS